MPPYLYPDYIPYLRGALVASSYSLSLANQPEIGDKWPCNTHDRSATQANIGDEPKRCPREPFQSMGAEGIFHATLALLSKKYDPVAKPYAPYCHGDASPKPSPEGLPCVLVAPVSINVIAEDGYWTLPDVLLKWPASRRASNLTAASLPTAEPQTVPPPSRLRSRS